jgi:predicted acyltransferase
VTLTSKYKGISSFLVYSENVRIFTRIYSLFNPQIMTKGTSPVPAFTRFTALDIFRGLTICFMIIVNTSGNGATTYWPLEHAHWNGFTPTDLVFPSFLFAVGNALSFVMKRWDTMKQQEVLFKIIKRTTLIFLVGYLMYWFPFFKIDAQSHILFSPISHTRIFGVLQRIALCYGIVALMVYYLGTKKTIWLGVFFLFAYWGLLSLFGQTGAEYTMTGNAVLRLDTMLFGTNHLYMGEGIPFDPEGLLSTLPALFNVIGGYAVGRYLQRMGKSYEGLTKVLLTGIGLLFIAYCWNSFFPVNKKLWTSSYAVLTVGLDCIILSGIVYVTDILQKTKGTSFFLIAGKNPLLIYLMSELGVTVLWMIKVGNEPLYHWIYTHIFIFAGDYFGAFLFSVWWMLSCWLLGYVLDRKKVYVRL